MGQLKLIFLSPVVPTVTAEFGIFSISADKINEWRAPERGQVG